MAIDELDKRILRELLRNSRRSFRQLAEELGVSTGTILKRVKDMKSEGVIKVFSVILDYAILGYEVTAITEVTVSKGKLIEMEKKIAEISNVCAVYDTTGLTDAIIIAKFKSIEELSNFTKVVQSLPYVERTNTHVVLNIVKEEFKLI